MQNGRIDGEVIETAGVMQMTAAGNLPGRLFVVEPVAVNCDARKDGVGMVGRSQRSGYWRCQLPRVPRHLLLV
jgi:hypothetical protein